MRVPHLTCPRPTRCRHTSHDSGRLTGERVSAVKGRRAANDRSRVETIDLGQLQIDWRSPTSRRPRLSPKSIESPKAHIQLQAWKQRALSFRTPVAHRRDCECALRRPEPSRRLPFRSGMAFRRPQCQLSSDKKTARRLSVQAIPSRAIEPRQEREQCRGRAWSLRMPAGQIRTPVSGLEIYISWVGVAPPAGCASRMMRKSA